MVSFSHDEIPSDPPPLGGSYNFAKDIARQARDAACGLYSDFPGLVTAGTIPGSPAHEWIRGFWNDMCRNAPPPLPPPPEPPFSGGQCPCVSYRIAYRVRSFPEAEFSPTLFTTRNGRIQGFGSIPFGSLRSYTVTWTPCSGGVEQSPVTDVYLTDGGTSEVQIQGITRVDGLPDECGDPPPVYPPPTKPVPPGSEYTTPYNPPGTDKPGNGFNITVPLVYVDAEANLNIDVGGVTVNFDLGGVSFNIDNKFGDGSPGSIGNPPSEVPDYTDAINGAKNAADAAKTAADDAKTAADDAAKAARDRAGNRPGDPQNDPNQQEKDEKTEEDPKEEDAINRLLAVQVDVLQMPRNRRTQDGGDAPDVNYCGWFEFKTKGIPHPRVPIHFESNYFIAPVGADGYAYTLYNGFKGRAIVITSKDT